MKLVICTFISLIFFSSNLFARSDNKLNDLSIGSFGTFIAYQIGIRAKYGRFIHPKWNINFGVEASFTGNWAFSGGTALDGDIDLQYDWNQTRVTGTSFVLAGDYYWFEGARDFKKGIYTTAGVESQFMHGAHCIENCTKKSGVRYQDWSDTVILDHNSALSYGAHLALGYRYNFKKMFLETRLISAYIPILSDFKKPPSPSVDDLVTPLKLPSIMAGVHF